MEYELSRDINCIKKSYEDVERDLNYLTYDQIKRKAERMVGRDVIKTMDIHEVMNLVAGA